MKKIINYFYYATMVGLVIWFAYTKGWILADFESVSPKEAIMMIENDDNLTLLDVRTVQEYKHGHLHNATLIPLAKLEENLNRLTPLKKKKILVYCRSGNRSVAAAHILKKHGFTPVNVREGIFGLMDAGAQITR